MSTEWADWEQEILVNFLDGERIVRLPAKRKKRLVVLRWLVDKFEPERHYSQTELNRTLAQHHPDTATIRREFIVYGFMDRESSVYWRLPDADRAAG